MKIREADRARHAAIGGLVGLLLHCTTPGGTRAPTHAPQPQPAGGRTSVAEPKPPARSADPADSKSVAHIERNRTSARPTPFAVTRPWWATIMPGLYLVGDRIAVMATGLSSEHRHPAEGFLQAKVRARLAVRRAAQVIAFEGRMPEPVLEDVFITAANAYWVLYRLDLAADVDHAAPAAWAPPRPAPERGRHRIGKHIFDGPRHLYLECPIEGPIANPDWGQSRASARWIPHGETNEHP